MFLGLFTALLVIGAVVALLPNVPAQLLVGVQVLNGILLPMVLVFILVLGSDPQLTGNLRNGRLSLVLGWGTFVLVTTAVLVLLVSQALGAFGVSLFGAS
jgi:Mn2+/Fe2+ NRAMP family transporter